MSRYEEESSFPEWASWLIFGAAGLFIALICYLMFTTRVDAGQACSVTVNGRQEEVAGPGLHFTTPWPRPVKYHCYNTRIQTIEFVDGEPKDSASKATYVDYNMDTHSVDGQRFSVTAIVQYQVSPEHIADLYASGARSNEAVYELLVKTQVRALVPQMLNTYGANTLYTGELGNISEAIKQSVQAKLAPYGITIKDLLVKRPVFTEAYENAIEQAGLQKAQEQAVIAQQGVAKQEAERKRVEAEGNAAVSIINQNTVNTNIVSAAQAQAEANTAIAQVYTDNPALLEHERIQAIVSANVIYLPDDVLPIMQVTGGANAVNP